MPLTYRDPIIHNSFTNVVTRAKCGGRYYTYDLEVECQPAVQLFVPPSNDFVAVWSLHADGPDELVPVPITACTPRLLLKHLFPRAWHFLSV